MSDLVEKFNKNCPEELKKMGILFCLLNRIENNLNHIIEIFFCDFNGLKATVLNDFLVNSKSISLETKREIFIKIIHHTSIMAEKKNLLFDKDKWKEVISEIQKLQDVRNKLAHSFLGFKNGDKAFFIQRLKNEQLENGKKSFFKKKEIDLDEEIERFDKIFDETELLRKDFLNQVFPIVRDCQMCNLSDI